MPSHPCSVSGCQGTSVSAGSLCAWHKAHEEYVDGKPAVAPGTVAKRKRLEHTISNCNRLINEARFKRDRAQDELDKLNRRAAA